MKKIITITILLLFIACKKENNSVKKVKEVKKGFENVKQTLDIAKKFEKNTKKLSGLTPITKEQIKAWMPEELEGLKRSSFQISKDMGMKIKLVFKGDKGKKININIIDGAGNGAEMMAMFGMMQNMDIDRESDTGYERTQKFGNQKVYVKYKKSDNYEKSKLQCTLEERFGIEANAWKMTPKELWEFIQKLEIEQIITK